MRMPYTGVALINGDTIPNNYNHRNSKQGEHARTHLQTMVNVQRNDGERKRKRW